MGKKFEPHQSAWAVITNSDLTEGRGRAVVKCVCDLEATALRLARKAGVQGTDARVVPVDLYIHPDGQTFGGISIYGPVSVVGPSKEDTAETARIKARRDALHKARAAGLTDEDIAALRGET